MRTSTWQLPTKVTLLVAGLATVAAAQAPDSVVLSDDWQGQQTGYWCGPASTRIALSTRISPPSQAQLASEEGTTVDGTDNVGIVAGVLNAHFGVDIYRMTGVNNSPTAEQSAALRANLVATLSNGFPLVANIWSGWRPPFYPGGTIFHYVAVVGYDQGGDRALIADPAGRVNPGGSGWANVPAHYWIATSDLAVWVGGKGYAGTNLPPKPGNAMPVGSVDASGCDGTMGWAQDPDAPDTAIAAHVYYGGPAGGGTGIAAVAELARVDLCSAIGSCNHGFIARWPDSFSDGQPHEVHIYGIDSAGGANPELPGSPVMASCTPPKLSGLRRHVTGPASFEAWGLDYFWGVRPLADADANALTMGPDLPATPVLVQAAPDPRVFLLDSGSKRHVPSPAVLAAWGFDASKIEARTAAELEALPDGSPLPERRVVARQANGTVWVIDVPAPKDPDPVIEPVTPPTEAEPVKGKLLTDLRGGCGAAPADALAMLAIMVLAAPVLRRRRR